MAGVDEGSLGGAGCAANEGTAGALELVALALASSSTAPAGDGELWQAAHSPKAANVNARNRARIRESIARSLLET